MSNIISCLYLKLRFASGGYYIFCDDCGASWFCAKHDICTQWIKQSKTPQCYVGGAPGSDGERYDPTFIGFVDVKK